MNYLTLYLGSRELISNKINEMIRIWNYVVVENPEHLKTRKIETICKFRECKESENPYSKLNQEIRVENCKKEREKKLVKLI